MNGELNFAAVPFEAYEGFQTSSEPPDVEIWYFALAGIDWT